MKGRQVIIGQLFGTEAAALMQDGQLEDLFLSAEDLTALAPGAICRARVNRLLKGQGGAFVKLPDGQSGYLRERSGLSEGQVLVVQVTGVAEEGKAIPLSPRIMLKGRNVIVTPGAPGINVSRRIRDAETRDALEEIGKAALGSHDNAPGIIFRSIAATADPAEVEAELDALLGISTAVISDPSTEIELLVAPPSPAELAWCEWSDPAPDSVEEDADAMHVSGADEAATALLSPRTDLGGSAWASIDTLPALTAIDVNTGSDHSPAAGLKANIALARDLPRQLRLRGIGGQIVIDFAPLAKRDRGTLDQVLKAAFKADGAETVLIGWTNMGLYEISRKRDRLPLRLLAEHQR